MISWYLLKNNEAEFIKGKCHDLYKDKEFCIREERLD